MKLWGTLAAVAVACLIAMGVLIGTAAQASCGGTDSDQLSQTMDGPGSLGGVLGTGVSKGEIKTARNHPYGGTTIVPHEYTATAYAPAAGGINCGDDCASTASGIAVDGGKRRAYLIASNPKQNKYGALTYAWPNPYGWHGPFVVADTGGNFDGSDGQYRVDFYIWGDAGESKSNSWGRRSTRLSQESIAGNADSGVTIPQLAANGAPSSQNFAPVTAKVAKIKGSPVGYAVVNSQGEVIAQTGAREIVNAGDTAGAVVLLALSTRAGNRSFTERESSLAASMLENGDDDARAQLVKQLGKDAVDRAAARAGMRSWSTARTDLSLSSADVTAGDLARLFTQIDDLVPARHRGDARTWLTQSTDEGHFGVNTAGIGGTILSQSDATQTRGGWQLAQGGQFLSGNRTYGFAMVLGDQRSGTDAANAFTNTAQDTYNTLGGAEDNEDANVGCASVPSGEAPNGKGVQAVYEAAAWLDKQKYPYCYGGGHVTPAKPTTGQYCWSKSGVQVKGSPDKGYDCSSSTSFILQHAGVNVSTMVSGGFMTWGKPGPGQSVTIYANAEHVFLKIYDRFFSTSETNYRHGPGWVPASVRSTAGFVVRHPEGM